MTVTIRKISQVELSTVFAVNSAYYNYGADRAKELSIPLAQLIYKWQADGLVEIYETKSERTWGRIKPSYRDALVVRYLNMRGFIMGESVPRLVIRLLLLPLRITQFLLIRFL